VTSRWYGPVINASCWSSASDTARLTAAMSSNPTPASESMITRISLRWPARTSSRFSRSNPVLATASWTAVSMTESGFADWALTVASWVAKCCEPARRAGSRDHQEYRVTGVIRVEWITPASLPDSGAWQDG